MRATKAVMWSVVCAVGAWVGVGCSKNKAEPEQSAPAPASQDRPTETPSPAQVVSGGRVGRQEGNFAGVGWSLEADTDKAVRSAYGKAVEGEATPPDLSLVFYTPHHQPAQIMSALKGAANAATRFMGMSTHDAVLTPDGYKSGPNGVVGVLSLRIKDMRAGVGSVSYEGTTSEAAAKAALLEAQSDAGAAKGSKPSMILMFGTITQEEKVLTALKAEIGDDIPIFGGSAAGSVPELEKQISPWSVLSNTKTFKNGVSLAAFYSKEAFGWAYRGGFERTQTHGVITEADDREIHKIDNRPATEVYNEWIGGKWNEALAAKKIPMIKFTGAYPLAKVLKTPLTTHNKFVHVWEDPKRPGSLMAGANVKVGDELFLCEGTWNTLLNRFADLPRLAKQAQPKIKPVAGLFIYCGGAIEAIPYQYRPHMASLADKSMEGLPWLGAISWSEQGHVPGLGNLTANLSSSTVLFPAAQTGN